MNKGQRTKEKIASLSSKLFNTKGFHGTSLTDIMDITGMEKGGIYNHFSTKEEICLAAFDQCFVKLLERFKEHYQADGTREQKLESVLNFYESLYREPILEGNHPLIGLGMYADDISEDLVLKVKQAFEKLEYIISVILQENMEEDQTITSEFLFSAINGSLFLSFFLKDAHYLNDTLKAIRKLI